MILYAIITEILWRAFQVENYIKKANDVKTRNVAYNINKSFNYINQVINYNIL